MTYPKVSPKSWKKLLSVREAAAQIAEAVAADVVQVIGSKAVLYRPAKEPKIELPK